MPQKKIDGTEDAVLIEEFANRGDPALFAELFPRHISAIRSFCRRFLRRDDGAEDLAHDSFLAAMESAGQFKGGSFRAWLLGITRHRALDHVRKPDVSRIEFWPEEHLDRIATPSEDLAEIVLDAISRLDSARQRQAIKMFWLEERSYKEIALAMNCSLSSVKSYLQNGMRNLRIILGAGICQIERKRP